MSQSGKEKRKATTIVKTYLYEVNYIIGLFSYSLFIGCLSLNDKDKFIGCLSQQNFYALVSAAVVFLSVITRGKDIRENSVAKKTIDELNFFHFMTTSSLYLIGFVGLIILGLRFPK